MTPHGSVSTYTNYRCRCAPCTEAWSRYHRAWRARRAGTDLTGMHGRLGTYVNYNCRCDQCRAANTAACREWRSRAAVTS